MVSSYKELDDEQLVRRLKDGSHKAFETLFRRYYTSICAYATRFLDDARDAESVACDVMVWLWEKHEQIQIETDFRHYLYSMVYHRACKIAVRNRQTQSTAVYMEEYRRRHELNESDFMVVEELKERIRKAIDALPETYRTAFLMYRFEGKSCKEIAEIYNLSQKTIYYRIQQALKQLHRDLCDYLPAVALAIVLGYMYSDGFWSPDYKDTRLQMYKIHEIS